MHYVLGYTVILYQQHIAAWKGGPMDQEMFRTTTYSVEELIVLFESEEKDVEYPPEYWLSELFAEADSGNQKTEAIKYLRKAMANPSLNETYRELIELFFNIYLHEEEEKVKNKVVILRAVK